jgi:hypothetical protein
MNLPTRFIALALTVSAALATVATACPETSEELGIDFWHVSALESDCAHEEQFEQAIDRETEQVRRRIDVRQSVVSDMLDGRRTLADAAAVFAELNRAHVRAGGYAKAYFGDKSDVEIAALQVIEQVKRSLDPRGEKVAAALKAEFDRGAVR